LHCDPRVTCFVRALNREQAVDWLEQAERQWRNRRHAIMTVLDRRRGRFVDRTGVSTGQFESQRTWPEERALLVDEQRRLIQGSEVAAAGSAHAIGAGRRSAARPPAAAGGGESDGLKWLRRRAG